MWWQGYDYDGLNRLQRVHEYNGNDWQQEYVYDRYGNRTIHQTNTWGVGINKKEFTVNTANNRLGVPGGQSGTMTYDAAGNLTTDTYSGAAVTRAYDAENRMTSETQAGSVVAGSYTYNAEGQRVRRTVAGVDTWAIYGMAGELLAEYAPSAAVTSPQKEYGYRNGQLLVTATVPVTVVTGLQAQYLDNMNFTDLKLTRTDATVDFDWGGGTPHPSMGVDSFTVRWQGKVEPQYSQTYTFYTQTDDGVRLWVNGQLLINKWIDQGPTEWSGQIALTAGQRYDIVMEFYENGGGAMSRLSWSSASQAKQIIPQSRLYMPGSSSQVAIEWLVTDQLGTPRMVFDKTGELATTKRHDYLPFGEELFAGQGLRTPALGYTGDNIRQKFTSYERDIETGLDYARARYYSNIQGRFTSTDPIYFQAMMGVDPQRFNLYAYARNNPLQFIDPNGEKLHLRGDALNVAYDSVGGQETFEKYFEVKDGEILRRAGADLSEANEGVKFMGELVARGENFLFYAGTDAAQAASYFKASGGLTNEKLQRDFNGAYIVGTLGRGNATPADLPNGEAVFAAIAINTANLFTQKTDLQENLDGAGTGTPFDMNVVGALIQGMGQRVKPVSLFIHEAAENLRFAQIGVNHPVLGIGDRRKRQYDNYNKAHNYAKRREALIRKELNIMGGFAGGSLEK